MSSKNTKAFTLIELSIVLVIIGLIVGGVLVGRDLIRAAEVRAQISQIEKYQTTVNTYKGKYNMLPGDTDPITAAHIGSVARSGAIARGNNDGIIQGACYGCGNASYGWNQNGETLFFWEDLSAAQLIDGRFNTATDADVGNITTNFQRFYPNARIGNNVMYVYSAQLGATAFSGGNPAINYFGISIPVSINSTGNWDTNPGLTVSQAYNIDKKIDDGMPLTGKTLAQYAVGIIHTPAWGTGFAPNASTASSTTCFDTTTNQYSITQNNGNGVNCALSFQFQ